MKTILCSLALSILIGITVAESATTTADVCRVSTAGDPLLVRATPSGRRVGSLRNGTQVFILSVVDDDGYEWAQVSVIRRGRRRVVGWVAKEFIYCY